MLYTDKEKQYQKQYREKNREKILKREKEYKDKAKEFLLEYLKVSCIKRKDKQQNKNTYFKNRKRKDLSFRLRCNLSSRLLRVLNYQNTCKNNKTMNYVGCSKADLLKHLGERKCNYCNSLEKIEVDHIYPLSKVDLTIEDNIYKVMNYKNLQYLCRNCNAKKNDKVIHKI